jgi:hypothetical protein
MFHGFVACSALGIIIGRNGPSRLMHIVAGKARERSVTALEAGALVEVDRLMAHIPGPFQVSQTFVLRIAMAAAAELIDPGGREALRILNQVSGRMCMLPAP